MTKDRLIIKSEWNHDEIHALLCEATLHRYKHSPKVSKVLKKAKRNVMTRLEFRESGKSDLTVLVELFERFESDDPIDKDGE